MKILLAVDGSAYTRRMLGYTGAHDELFGTRHEYTAVTVVPFVPARAASFVGKEILQSYYHEQGEQVLGPVRQYAAQAGWDFDARYLVGHAGEAISQLAEEGKFDLIVMGSQGHSALGGLVLGSVSMRVIAGCKVPVLLIR